MQALSGMVVYFVVMNDYGFKPSTLFFLNLKSGVVPNPGDSYDPYDTDPNHLYGNSNSANPAYELSALAWGSNEGTSMDIRLFYTSLSPSAWSPCRYQPDDNSYPYHWRYSVFTNQQICYTSEALFYAQTAYFIATITTQWSNCIISKTRSLSIAHQQMINWHLNFALISEQVVGALLSYVYFLNVAFNTRAIPPAYFAVPAL